jgi:hypothetical protein
VLLEVKPRTGAALKLHKVKEILAVHKIKKFSWAVQILNWAASQFFYIFMIMQKYTSISKIFQNYTLAADSNGGT